MLLTVDHGYTQTLHLAGRRHVCECAGTRHGARHVSRSLPMMTWPWRIERCNPHGAEPVWWAELRQSVLFFRLTRSDTRAAQHFSTQHDHAMTPCAASLTVQLCAESAKVPSNFKRVSAEFAYVQTQLSDVKYDPLAEALIEKAGWG